MNKSSNINISFILVLAMFAVSTSPVAAEILNQNGSDGIMSAFWRMSLACLILCIFSSVNRPGSFNSKKNLKMTIFSGFFLGLHFACFFIALDLTKMANATFLGTLTPVFTLILEVIILKRRFSNWVYIGLALAVTGALIIFLGSPLDLKNNDMRGNLFALICSLILAISFIISERVRQSENTITYTRSLYGSAALTLLILALMLGRDVFPEDNQIFLFSGFVYLGLIPTIVGHNAFYYSLKYVKPTIVATIPLAEPIIASIIGYFLFPLFLLNAELFTDYWHYTIIGGSISLLGIFLVIKNKK
tara:strand:+ start:273 stop:1184 length:912 start_codon:yes stop_codon:yes gene_type:complete